MDFLLKPLGWILEQLAYLFNGSFAWSVFVFTLIVNILMIPLNIKTQKSSVGQMRIRPKMEALKQKYGDDKQRYQTELQKLYSEENISMSGGCLPMLIRLPIMLGVYRVVLSPLKYIMGVSETAIAAGKAAVEGITGSTLNGYYELNILEYVEKSKITSPEISQKMSEIDFNFFGIKLTDSPKFNFDIIHNFELSWLIPVLAFAAAMLTSIVSMKIQKRNNPDAPSMSGMMLTMPFISLIIGFSVSCAAGFYWACSSLISGAIQSVIQIYYGPGKMIASQQAKELIKRNKEEKEIKAKVNNVTEK